MKVMRKVQSLIGSMDALSLELRLLARGAYPRIVSLPINLLVVRPE